MSKIIVLLTLATLTAVATGCSSATLPPTTYSPLVATAYGGRMGLENTNMLSPTPAAIPAQTLTTGPQRSTAVAPLQHSLPPGGR
jgi:hypothetical protein